MPPERKISYEAWDCHFDELRGLYVNEDKPLPYVMRHMQEKYNFIASKNQYETTFKKWNFRKNLSQSEWEYVHHRIKKRKGEEPSKESAVYLNNTRIPEKKTKRELQRRFPPTFDFACSRASTPETPPEILVMTPSSNVHDSTPATPRDLGDMHLINTPESTRFLLNEIVLNNLPSFQFLDLFESQMGQDWVSCLFTKSSFSSDFSLNISGAPGDTLALDWEEMPCNAIVDPGNKKLQTISTSLLEKFVPRGRSQNQTLLEAAGFSDPWSCGVVGTSQEGARDNMKQQVSIEYSPTIHSCLGVFLLERFEGDLEARIKTLLSLSDRESLAESVKLMAQLGSNNMLDSQPIDNFIEWVKQNNQLPTLRKILSTKLPTVKAFAHRIFDRVVIREDVKLVKLLLEAGICPNVLLRYSRETPLYHAVEEENVELVDTLLQAGADPNFELSLGVAAPINLAVEKGQLDLVRKLLDAKARIDELTLGAFSEYIVNEDSSSRKTSCLELIRALLEAGAGVYLNEPYDGVLCTRTVLQSAAEAGNLELARILLDAGANINAPPPTTRAGVSPKGCTVFQAMMNASVDDDSAIEMAMLLLEAGARVNTSTVHGSYWETEIYGTAAVTALQAAASGGNTALLKQLLEGGADVNEPAPEGGMTALQHAILGRNIDAIRLLLAEGADVNAPSSKNGLIALEAAASTSNIEVLKLLLSWGAVVNPHGRSLLPSIPSHRLSYLYEKSERLESARILLKAGAEVNPECGKCPLEEAARIDDIELVNLLIQAGADEQVAFEKVVSTDYYSVSRMWIQFSGHAALAIAVLSRDVESVRRLLLTGVEVNQTCIIQDRSGYFTWVTNALPLVPKFWGDVAQQIAIAQLLLDAGADINASALIRPRAEKQAVGTTVLLKAVKEGPKELAQYLINAGADVNERPNPFGGYTPFHEAVEKGDVELVQLMIKAGADIDAPLTSTGGGCALYLLFTTACGDSRPTIANLLLDAGADVNVPPTILNGETVLQLSIRFGYRNNEQLANRIITLGADVNAPRGGEDLRTALEYAIKKGLISLAHRLLLAGAYVNTTSSANDGRTALLLSIEGGHIEFTQHLIQMGADFNVSARGPRGRTALQAAIEENNIELAQHLLELGADVNAPPAEDGGVTALQVAAIRGQLGFALTLLRAGADINAAPAKIEGRTALAGAAEHGRLDMVQLLLNAGADIGGRHAVTARDLAKNNGHMVVAEILEVFC